MPKQKDMQFLTLVRHPKAKSCNKAPYYVNSLAVPKCVKGVNIPDQLLCENVMTAEKGNDLHYPYTTVSTLLIIHTPQ
jgi:hypothetical protein